MAVVQGIMAVYDWRAINTIVAISAILLECTHAIFQIEVDKFKL